MQYDDGDWKELRARVDSLAAAVFLIAGGALTLSISVLLKLKENTPEVKDYASEISLAWYMLLISIICFVALKTWLITLSFMRGFMEAESYNPTVKYTNTIGWLLGISGLGTFVVGMSMLVVVAAGIAHA